VRQQITGTDRTNNDNYYQNITRRWKEKRFPVLSFIHSRVITTLANTGSNTVLQLRWLLLIEMQFKTT